MPCPLRIHFCHGRTALRNSKWGHALLKFRDLFLSSTNNINILNPKLTHEKQIHHVGLLYH
jgi:hypothetical protein